MDMHIVLQEESKKGPTFGGLWAAYEEILCGLPVGRGQRLRGNDLSPPRNMTQQLWSGTTVKGHGTGSPGLESLVRMNVMVHA